MSIEIKVPSLGESVSTATIARWLKKPGDAVAAAEPVVELETDKVTVEVPAPAAGRLGEILAADGTLVKDSEKSYLCRCGFSEKKPFCDGAHKREGFTAP